MPSPNTGRRDSRAWTWLRHKARLMPGLLVEMPSWVHDTFDHAWAPMENLAQQLRPLSPNLWSYLARCTGGFAVISVGDSRYVQGPAAIGKQQEHNVAFLSVEDLASGNERPLRVIGHLIDHYLGCRGNADGPWLSEGGGLTSAWREAGKRLPQLHALGYGVDEVALSSVPNYFAQSLAIYCRDRQRLNIADPQIHKWLRATLWNQTLWQALERD